MSAWNIAKRAAGGVVLGGFVYLSADTASDLYTCYVLRQQALQIAHSNQNVADLVGRPYVPSPWYTTMLGFSHQDRLAHVSFQVTGPLRTTDIIVRGTRQSGYGSNILYNLLGPRSWDVLTCAAMFPTEGGLAEPKSIMPPIDSGKVNQDCDDCMQQAQAARGVS